MHPQFPFLKESSMYRTILFSAWLFTCLGIALLAISPLVAPEKALADIQDCDAYCQQECSSQQDPTPCYNDCMNECSSEANEKDICLKYSFNSTACKNNVQCYIQPFHYCGVNIITLCLCTEY